MRIVRAGIDGVPEVVNMNERSHGCLILTVMAVAGVISTVSEHRLQQLVRVVPVGNESMMCERQMFVAHRTFKRSARHHGISRCLIRNPEPLTRLGQLAAV